MKFRSLILVASVMTLAACASNDKAGMGDTLVDQERENITAGPLDGMEVLDRNALAGPMAGSQQDLVVNVGDRVFFGYDRSDLSGEAQQSLQMQARWLQQYPSVNITLEGHADERGTREYNLALGARRAQAVKSFLVALGVDPRRISTLSYGKERPAALGSNAEAWAQNRRGVTIVN